jgi:hypothetical protein
LRVQYGAFVAELALVREAVEKQVHDDTAVLAAWDACTDEVQRYRAKQRLETMLARSTASINNSYLKMQIATGLEIGLIALFLTVFGQLKYVVGWLLVIGVVMNAASIGVSLLITTAQWRTTWTEIVKEPGVYALRQGPREEYLALSRHAFNNRVVLLRKRRIAWLATWLLTLPGLILAMLSWAWPATVVALAMLVGLGCIYRKQFAGAKPTGPKVYPAH